MKKKVSLLLLPLLFTSIAVSADDSTTTNGKSGFLGDYPEITQVTNIIENKIIDPQHGQSFVDENKIENLVKGENYRLVSRVYNKTNDKFEEQFTKNTEFKADNEDMTLNIKLQGSAENLDGDTLVVHQTLIDAGPQKVRKGQVVSVSNDNNDEKEMVYVRSEGRGGITPAPIKTKATDTSGRHSAGLYLSITSAFGALFLGLYLLRLKKKGNN